MLALKRLRLPLLGVAGSLIVAVALLVESAGRPAAGAGTTTERVSVSSAEVQANGVSGAGGGLAISGDGRYVAFVSEATNLVAGTTTAVARVYLRDTVTGTTELISVSTAGVPANLGAHGPAISADGRFVAFDATDSDLDGTDKGSGGTYIRDRQSGRTEWIAPAHSPALSPDGRFIAYSASTLLSSGHWGPSEIYVRDRLTGVVDKVSVPPTGDAAFRDSTEPTISADGRFVAFRACPPTGPQKECWQVHAHDRLTHQTQPVSVDPSGDTRRGSSVPVISADGRFVAFRSDAPLVSGDSGSSIDVFVRDIQAGVTELVNVSSSGERLVGASYNPAISADGRFIAFATDTGNFGGTFTGSRPITQSQIAVRDRLQRTTEPVSVNAAGQIGDQPSGVWYASVALSADGRKAAFASHATNLVPGDTNELEDVFVRDGLCRRGCELTVPSLTVTPSATACARACTTMTPTATAPACGRSCPTATPTPTPTTCSRGCAAGANLGRSATPSPAVDP
jgi:Tol biopolymer transport system component